MERIKKAVELAKANRNRLGDALLHAPVTNRVKVEKRLPRDENTGPTGARAVRLDPQHLRSMRIIAHDVADPRSRGFEMLRTQLFRQITDHGHHTIGVTSPTAGCGKTVCALNLALSIARLPERSVTLVDLDLRKPQVALYLGLSEGQGMVEVLRSEAELDEISIVPEIGAWRFRVLPTYKSSRSAAELIASNRMADVVRQLRAADPDGIILFDLPPVLVVDDVISFLPQLDSVLLIVASGQTTVSDISNSERLLGPTNLMGLVLNKSEEATEAGYTY